MTNDITTEDLLRVARGMEQTGFKFERIQGDENYYVHRQVAGKTFLCHFNPLTSDADAFKVLEAIFRNHFFVEIGTYESKDGTGYLVQDESKTIHRAKDLRTAIVKAWLSLGE